MNIMTVTDVAELIPNRYPILFIDRVDELVPGEYKLWHVKTWHLTKASSKDISQNL